MLGNRRQGLAVLGVMGVLWSVSLAVTTWAEVGAHSPAAQAAGAAMEGKETRFGEWASALFAVATTGTSTGAVNASHDSLTAGRRRHGAGQHDARRDRRPAASAPASTASS